MICECCKKKIDKQNVKKYPNKMYFFRLGMNASKSEISIALGISEIYLHLLETGIKTPSFALSKRIADLYKTTVDDIFFSYEKEIKEVSNN